MIEQNNNSRLSKNSIQKVDETIANFELSEYFKKGQFTMMSSQVFKENRNYQTFIETKIPNHEGQQFSVDTLVKNVAIRFDRKSYETINNDNLNFQQPKFEEWYDPSLEFEKIFHCHYWDSNDLDRKGKILLTNRELYFKCAGLPFIGTKINLKDIQKVSTTKSYKKQFKSALLIHCNNELHAFYKFHVPKSIVKNSIILYINRLEDLNENSTDFKYSPHKLDHLRKKINDIKCYIKTPDNDLGKNHRPVTAEVLENIASLPFSEPTSIYNEVDKFQLEAINYKPDQNMKYETSDSSPQLTTPNYKKQIKEVITPKIPKKSIEPIATRADQTAKETDYEPEPKIDSSEEPKPYKDKKSTSVKFKNKKKVLSKPKSLQIIPSAWNRTKTDSENEEKTDDQIKRKNSFNILKRDSSPILNNTKRRISNGLNRIQGRFRLKSNKEGFNSDDSYETADEGDLEPEKKTHESLNIDESDDNLSNISTDSSELSNEGIITNNIYANSESLSQPDSQFLFSFAIFLMLILSFMSLFNFIFLMSVEETIRSF